MLSHISWSQRLLASLKCSQIIITTWKKAKKKGFFISQSPKFSPTTCNIKCAVIGNILQTGFHTSTCSHSEINTCDIGIHVDLTEYQPYCSRYRYLFEAGIESNQHISMKMSILLLHIFLDFCIQTKYTYSLCVNFSDYYFQTKCCCVDYVQKGGYNPFSFYILTQYS